MKDIDFEELDRAVNSLMGTAPKKETVKANEPENDAALPVDESADHQDQEPEMNMEEATPASDLPDPSSLLDTPGAQEEQEPEAASPASTVSVAPSRGRFMDVVRPGGRDSKRPFPSTTVSRQGVNLTPSSLPARNETVDTAAAPRDENSSPESESLPSPAQEDLESLALGTIEPSEDTTVSSPMMPSLDASEELTPLTSPFLPDAKVEKRPLGRPVEATTAEDTSEESNGENPVVEPEAMSTEPVAPEDKDAQLPGQPLPAELTSEVLSIETGATPETPVAEKDAEISAAPEMEMPTPTPTATEDTSPMHTLAQASIPQQYKLQSDVSEEPSVGSIYDTQPLAHPPKKYPGWMLIAAIIAILLLGAAGGALVYYLGLL